MDDAALTALALRAAEGNDEEARERLVRETRGDVVRFIGWMAAPAWVEDLTQETFLRAMRGLPGFAGRARVRSWLLAIARHTVVDRYRAAAARPRTAGVEDWESLAPSSAGGQGRFEEEFALLELIAELPEPRRTAFVLTRLHGFSYAEAADRMGVAVGTVRSRVARARGDLIAVLRGERAGWRTPDGPEA